MTMAQDQVTTPSSPGLPVWSQGVIGASVTLIAAWMTYLGVRRKAKAEEASTSIESQAQALETLIQGLTTRVEKLEQELILIRTRNSDLEQENLTLRLEVRHKDDLLDAYTRWIKAYEQYVKDGSPNPPGSPPYSWQMLQHLKEATDIAREPP